MCVCTRTHLRCVCVGLDAIHRVHVLATGQLQGVSSLLPSSHGLQGLNSDHQTCKASVLVH